VSVLALKFIWNLPKGACMWVLYFETFVWFCQICMRYADVHFLFACANVNVRRDD
jgi:hypothetical protein